nr:hypothetical protein [Tanacetum cinerariifolium]
MQCAGFDHDHYQEAACAYHEEHMMHNCVQLDHVVDSHDEYMHDSNIIMCDKHVRDNEVPVVHSDSEDMQCAGFDHDHYQEAACVYHEEHMMHDCVQLDHVVDSHDEYKHYSNIIMCDQYVRDNEVPVVHSGATSVPTDAFMMIYDDMCEPHDQSVSYPSQNTVVKNFLTAELAIYKEHVELPPTPDKDTPDFDSVFVLGKMQASLQGKDNVIRQLKKELSQLQVTHQDTDRTLRVQTTDSKITKLTDQATHLQAQNDLFRAENDKIKQHYKELYNSIKITRAKHIEQVTKLTTKNMNLKTGVCKATVNPLVSARDKHAIDVEPIVPRLRNNRNAHLDYLRHLKESVETI